MCIFICHIGRHDRLWIFGIIGEIQTFIHVIYTKVINNTEHICVTVTRCVTSAGLDGGGPPSRLMYIRARAPPVAVCLVYTWRENLLVSRAARPHVQFVRQACREWERIFYMCVCNPDDICIYYYHWTLSCVTNQSSHHICNVRTNPSWK